MKVNLLYVCSEPFLSANLIYPEVVNKTQVYYEENEC